MDVGDHVKLHPGGVAVFQIRAIEGEFATVEALQDAPGRYPFQTKIDRLVSATEA